MPNPQVNARSVVRVEGSRGAIHRPRLSWDYWENNGKCAGYVALSWGDANCDPVWGIEIEMPMWLAKALLDLHVWRWKRRTGASTT